MSGSLDPQLFGGGDLIVRIMDLSGGNGSDPVEEVRGFLSIEHANAFARRYVRDSVERCRAPGLDAKAVLDAWFAFGEDAEVVGAAENGWVSGSELKGFAETPVRDSEERNWRMLDPRRDEESEDAA
ncbi:MAG: hypothetical protein INF89_04455 [Roseomonas sp.]|nr:hypothetical protein [Roseomonas sp.]